MKKNYYTVQLTCMGNHVPSIGRLRVTKRRRKLRDQVQWWHRCAVCAHHLACLLPQSWESFLTQQLHLESEIRLSSCRWTIAKGESTPWNFVLHTYTLNPISRWIYKGKLPENSHQYFTAHSNEILSISTYVTPLSTWCNMLGSQGSLYPHYISMQLLERSTENNNQTLYHIFKPLNSLLGIGKTK